MSFDFDLFVIGGGSGGVRAARVAAAETGARVGLAEESRMGGTCVIRGCVPKKLMVFASEYAEAMREARDYGWDVRIGGFDWPAFRSRLEGELDRLEGIYNRLLEGSGVEVFAQRATLADPHKVRLADGTELTAKHILIATGGWPALPDLPGVEHAITSNEVFHLDALPERLLVVGGGYIACEMACIFNGLGTQVTQYYRGPQILRGFDGEAREHIAGHMIRHGVDIRCNTNVTALRRTAAGIEATDTAGEVRIFDQVLFATGRAPNTAGLGLEGAGVALGARGEVPVDEYNQTAVPSIFAIGDVTDRVQLTPVAIREGMAFVETVFRGNPTPVDHELIPSAVFTQPEYGMVGMSEEAAREAGPIEVYSTAFRPMHKGFIDREDRVLMKLIVCAKTRRVLGVHIVADHAGEMIQLAGIAVKMGATKEDFDRTVAVHPTMSEELVTLKTPVRRTGGDCSGA
ncbi:MAG: glutathione-disulfide reductase [Tropicimonas sp.]|uniref:glutathione-disulfide reductase n=1 Tax=Tropicimonas sp. TaxID=2067044 RepID=UPI003A875D2E